MSSLKAYIGLSGGYLFDEELVTHFHNKGLYRAVFYGIMEAGMTREWPGGRSIYASTVRICGIRIHRRLRLCLGPDLLSNIDSDGFKAARAHFAIQTSMVNDDVRVKNEIGIEHGGRKPSKQHARCYAVGDKHGRFEAIHTDVYG
ncbi:hypothetical protein CYMTET_3432 [Cymbomonas tetramitiformis]|uniref:Uncharacterized protein n=1 Tax=Cymbomonas tetramitiformis TaxID=36881 RepID=A0AAE0LL31_9CHLO|nr:hypothetical protein CYMTET_3432 [Cymbomonas tetramitiformis]